MNHNLKLVKLKKVKKVYTNLHDASGEDEFSKKPTIVDLDAKYNVITQTPIPFLILEKPIDPVRDDHFDVIRRKDLISERELRDKIFNTNSNSRDDLSSGFGDKLPLQSSNHGKSPGDSVRPNFNLFKHEEKKLGKTILLNGKLVKELDRRNDLEDVKAENAKNDISPRDQTRNDSRSKSIRVLFPSAGNKFKLSQFNKSYPSNRSTASHPIASASNKSTARTEFRNKLTTRSKPIITTTARALTTNSLAKLDKSRAFTTEIPRTFTYKPSRRTTTFKPYIYTSMSVTTSEPVLRIRKNRPTPLQTKSTTPSITPSPVDRKPKIELKNELELVSTTNSLNFGKEKPDLESNNSNRKYAKLFFDRDKADKKKNEKNGIEKNKIEGNKLDKEAKDKSQTTRPTIRSYWRANSRPPYTTHSATHLTTQRPTTASYSPYSAVTSPVTERPSGYETTTESMKESRRHEATTESPERSYETTTESLKRRRHETTTESLKRRSYETTTESFLKNVISREKILTAVRKRPVYRPRTVTPTQLTQLTTVRPRTEKPVVTTESTFRLTTAYSPRATTVYPLSYRSTTAIESTTDTSVSDQFTTRFRYAATPSFTTASKETSFYQPKLKPDKPAAIQPTDSPPSTDLMSNFIPRKSKWVLKSTRQRKSDHLDKEEPSTRPMYYSRPIHSTSIRPLYSATTTPSPFEPITRRTFVTTTPNEISKWPSRTIDRTPKSADPATRQTKKPKSFFASEENTRKESEPELKDLSYEPPKRERNTPVDLNLIDPDREIHYQDVKVRKESKLVPQTYLYSTSAPATVARLNERLSHLNDEKAKYQRLPYNNVDDGRIETYRRPQDEEVRPKYYEEEELVRPRYPNSIPYVPKLSSYPPNIPSYSSEPKPPAYSYERRPNDESNREDNSVPTTIQPFVRSHFNLGPPAQDQIVPKYGPIFKQVGKLSEAFHNQAPIPYFSPENSKELVAKEPDDRAKENHYDRERYEDRYREPVRYPINEQQNYNIDLKRYPVSKEPESTTVRNEQNEPDRYRVNSETVKPFDFANYKPLPNYKFIRTDLESNEIPEKKYKDAQPDSRPLIEIGGPIAERRPLVERPVVERPVLDPYSNDERNQFGYDPPAARPAVEKGTRFNFNRIPAKVVYDKYNQKFSGRVNLKKVNFVPTAKHYADIPNHVQPIEYQARPTAPTIDTTVRNRPTYKPIYQPIYNSPVANKPEHTKPIDNYNRSVYNNKPAYSKALNDKPFYVRPIYKPVNNPVNNPINNPVNNPINNKPINNPPHYAQPKNDYSRHKAPVFQMRPIDRPIIDQRPQFVSHFVPTNSRDTRPNEHQPAPRPNSRPAQFYSNAPVNPVNRQPASQPNRFNNQFNYEPPKNQFNYQPPRNQFNYEPPRSNYQNSYPNRASSQPPFGHQPSRIPFNNLNNQISGPFRYNQPSAPPSSGNLFGYSQPNRNQFNQFAGFRPPPQFRREANNRPQAKPPINAREKPLYSAQFDHNAGHYDFSDSDKNPVLPLQPNKQDVELIDLNDLALFDGKMPDFKLLQNTVISHDIPYKYLR